MILLKSVIQIRVGPMPNHFAQLAPDRGRVIVMTIGRDSIRDNPGHHRGRTKERLGGGEIAVLAQHHVNEGTIAVDGAIEIAPVAVNLDVRLINIPAAADATMSAATEFFGQSRGEFRLPVAHRLVAEHNGSVRARACGRVF